MALEDHLTPWGKRMPVHARAQGAKPGERVYHRTFGLGEVLTGESTEGQDLIKVHFLRSHA